MLEKVGAEEEEDDKKEKRKKGNKVLDIFF